MKIEKKLKSRKGFTLVELVVVIAVLAILAGVGTVAYSGYIKKADEAADLSQLAAIKTAADATAAASDDHFTVDSIKVAVDKDGVVSTIDISGKKSDGTTVNYPQITLSSGSLDDGSDFATFMKGNALKLKSDKYTKTGATWTTTGWAPTKS